MGKVHAEKMFPARGGGQPCTEEKHMGRHFSRAWRDDWLISRGCCQGGPLGSCSFSEAISFPSLPLPSPGLARVCVCVCVCVCTRASTSQKYSLACFYVSELKSHQGQLLSGSQGTNSSHGSTIWPYDLCQVISPPSELQFLHL